MKKNKCTKDEGGCRMAVSKAVVPLLKDDVAKSFMKTLEHSKLKPYTTKQSEATDRKIKKVLEKRAQK